MDTTLQKLGPVLKRLKKLDAQSLDLLKIQFKPQAGFKINPIFPIRKLGVKRSNIASLKLGKKLPRLECNVGSGNVFPSFKLAISDLLTAIFRPQLFLKKWYFIRLLCLPPL